MGSLCGGITSVLLCPQNYAVVHTITAGLRKEVIWSNPTAQAELPKASCLGSCPGSISIPLRVETTTSLGNVCPCLVTPMVGKPVLLSSVPLGTTKKRLAPSSLCSLQVFVPLSPLFPALNSPSSLSFPHRRDVPVP